MKYLLAILNTALPSIAAISDVRGNTANYEQTLGPLLQVLGSGGPIADDGRVPVMDDSGGLVKLVLSHFMARSLENLQDNLKEVRSIYSGSVRVAQDLDCVAL